MAFLWSGSSYGLYGVSLFFVLSGYLITSLLLLDRRRPHYYHNFYWKRVFRVLPPLVMVLVLTKWFGYQTWMDIVLALLFVMNFDRLFHRGESGPFWSLSIEEQFYLVWPAVVRKLKARAFRRILVVIIAIEPILRFLSGLGGHGGLHYTFMQSDGLAWGAWLAIIAYAYRIPYRNYNQTFVWKRFGIPTLVGGALLSVFSETLLAIGRHSYFLTLTGAVIFFTGVMTYCITHERSATARFLTLPPFIFLGNISYMMYLSHAYIMALYDRYVRSHIALPLVTEIYVRFFIVLAATLVFCTASLYLYERPINRLRRIKLK